MFKKAALLALMTSLSGFAATEAQISIQEESSTRSESEWTLGAGYLVLQVPGQENAQRRASGVSITAERKGVSSENFSASFVLGVDLASTQKMNDGPEWNRDNGVEVEGDISIYNLLMVLNYNRSTSPGNLIIGSQIGLSIIESSITKSSDYGVDPLAGWDPNSKYFSSGLGLTMGLSAQLELDNQIVPYFNYRVFNPTRSGNNVLQAGNVQGISVGAGYKF